MKSTRLLGYSIPVFQVTDPTICGKPWHITRYDNLISVRYKPQGSRTESVKWLRYDAGAPFASVIGRVAQTLDPPTIAVVNN
jgi:hypothetical protein